MPPLGVSVGAAGTYWVYVMVLKASAADWMAEMAESGWSGALGTVSLPVLLRSG